MASYNNKNSWFANAEPDDFLGGIVNNSNQKTLKDIDINALEEALADHQNNTEEINNLIKRMQQITKDTENYALLQDRNLSEGLKVRNNFIDKLGVRREHLSAQENALTTSMADAEDKYRAIANQADGHQARIEAISHDIERQRDSMEGKIEQTKRLILNIKSNAENTEAQLAGYTEQLDYASEQANTLIQEFNTQKTNLEAQMESIGNNLSSWRITFEEEAGDFQEKIKGTEVIVDSLLTQMATNTKAVEKIKEEAQRDVRATRDAINSAKADMRKMDELCSQYEIEANADYEEMCTKIKKISEDNASTQRVLKANQKDLEETQRRLAELLEERQRIAERTRQHFHDAELVSKGFADFKRTLINSYLAQVKGIAGAYDDSQSAMTGSARKQFDLLDTSKGDEQAWEQLEEMNRRASNGEDIYGVNKNANYNKPASNPQPPRYQQPVQTPVYDPEPQPVQQDIGYDYPEPIEQAPVSQYDSNINSDAMADTYMAQFTQGYDAPVTNQVGMCDDYGYDQPMYDDNMGYDNTIEPATGAFIEGMDDPAFNQNGNFMGTSSLIGDQGTQLFEGQDYLPEFDIPYSPEPDVEPQQTSKHKTGFFGRKK